jgi:signal peptidase I
MSQPQTSIAAPTPKPSSTGGVKDTIESILVAFILAFVFRAFIVEAFVIPTGSMATTLLGAHMRFNCPDCGYQFDVNYSPRQQPGVPEDEDPSIPSVAPEPLTSPIYCPNCGFQMRSDQVEKPAIFYGDRILVLKYLYMLEQPKRFDVVVFKAPIAAKSNFSTNYIKRLIGKPGEAVMVVDGDVYIRSPDAKNEDDFVIQTKPKAAQDALWRLVYDNDFHPHFTEKNVRLPVDDWQQPWTVLNGTGWKLDDPATNGRIFYFTGDNNSSRLQFNPGANPSAQSESDYLVYDQQSGEPPQIRPRSINGRFPDARTGEIPVSDLDLRVTYQRNSGQGPLNLTLIKRGHAFTAEIAPTKATLYQDYNGKRTMIGSPFDLKPSMHPVRIELSNADYQVTLRIDGDIAAQSTPADFAPDMRQLRIEFDDNRTPPPGSAEIEAYNQHCELSHLSLWRDVYYYNSGRGVLRATPTNPAVLKSDEYFVMGDNSILSYDARCWDKGVNLPAEEIDAEAGRVPARFMLGKAFYVYWPAGYLAYPGWPAFVPNFGSMRFIH